MGQLGKPTILGIPPFEHTLLRNSVTRILSVLKLWVVCVVFRAFCCDLYLAHPQGPGPKSSLWAHHSSRHNSDTLT